MVKGTEAAFRSADPFPHVVIDQFFSRTFCEQLIAGFPPFERGKKSQ